MVCIILIILYILLIGDFMDKKKIMRIVVSILIPLAAGGIGYLLGGSMESFDRVNKPTFSPPGILFPIVWAILYTLMGISSYLVYKTDSEYKKIGLTFYAIQLIVNVLWSMFFFRFQNYLFSFVWLILLILLVSIMMYYFYKSDKRAFYLQIPYLVWLVFAAILNYSIYSLN